MTSTPKSISLWPSALSSLRRHREVLLVHTQQHGLQQMGGLVRAAVILAVLAVAIRLLPKGAFQSEQFVVVGGDHGRGG